VDDLASVRAKRGNSRAASSGNGFRATAFGRLRGALRSLAAASQRRITRERFTSALNRSRGMYELDRLEVGAVGVAGDAAAIDTTIYGRVLEPVQGEGKIEVRQYLMRETGRWRVVTDDRAAVRRILTNKNLARRFPSREPRVFVKRDGRWVKLVVRQLPQHHLTESNEHFHKTLLVVVLSAYAICCVSIHAFAPPLLPCTFLER
jgi:hypothetical protein